MDIGRVIFCSHLTSPANLCYRFIIAGEKLRAAVKANSAKPFNFTTAYNLTKEQVSPEHQRPSAQLLCTKYRTSNKYHLQYWSVNPPSLQVHACLHVCSHIHHTHMHHTHTHRHLSLSLSHTHTPHTYIHTHIHHIHTHIHHTHHTHITLYSHTSHTRTYNTHFLVTLSNRI